jgi:ELWxxDGT repeat protein
MATNLGQVVLVKDINPGQNTSVLQGFSAFKNKLYFSANNGASGQELWVSDGTTNGTKLVKDIKPGGQYSSSFPGYLIVLNNKLYFSANDRVNGVGLWVSDGTTAGTELVKKFNPDNDNVGLGKLTVFENNLYFSSTDNNTINNVELWISDGTENGTQLFKDINPGDRGSYPVGYAVLNNQLYFSARDDINGRELWVSDGTSAGTQLVKDINPGDQYGIYELGSVEFVTANNKLFFAANNGINGEELWISNGTSEGTQLVKDIYPGLTSSYLGLSSTSRGGFAEFNNKLYFSAEDGVNGKELWVSDGTTKGTQLVKDILPGENGSYPVSFIVFNNKLYFAAASNINGSSNGGELWVTDGTSSGTQLVKDILPGDNNYYYTDDPIENFTIFNGKLYFAAEDGVHGKELWVTDGTTAGTQLVADINPGINASYPANFTVVGNELLFTASNGTTGTELFKLTFDGSTTITGTNRSDNLAGTANSDRIEGLNGNDTLSGLGGNDILLGGNGNDSLVGAVGNDSLVGGNNSDTLVGGNGNDSLTGGVGFDVLTGGTGNDIFVLKNGNGSDSITDFKLGSDKVGLTGGLEFEDLTLLGNTIKSGNELLATLIGVNTSNLTEANFIIV